MKKVIVTTTINPPTEAIELFDNLSDWTLVVIGDQKTPADYELKNGIYLSPDDQDKIAPKLSQLIDWNCIQRRNIGFVYALSQGADIVATIDDDNIPLDTWADNVLVGQRLDIKSYETSNGCFDPVGATEHSHLWHRGYPLQFLRSRDYSVATTKTVDVHIQADFWNGDPDIDAICRLEHAPDVVFDGASFPFTSDAVAPFNSQNTFLSAEALAGYFMVPGVGRMDDIWGGYDLQASSYRPIFCAASVKQLRNDHDLTKDLEKEVSGYTTNFRIVEAINNNEYDRHHFWPERACLAFDEYRRLTRG